MAHVSKGRVVAQWGVLEREAGRQGGNATNMLLHLVLLLLGGSAKMPRPRPRLLFTPLLSTPPSPPPPPSHPPASP